MQTFRDVREMYHDYCRNYSIPADQDDTAYYQTLILILRQAEQDFSNYLTNVGNHRPANSPLQFSQHDADFHAWRQEEFVNMVLQHERTVAGWVQGQNFGWTWALLRREVAELVIRKPVAGVEIVKSWNLRIHIASR